MTVLQGVAFAVSSFERKLACEWRNEVIKWLISIKENIIIIIVEMSCSKIDDLEDLANNIFEFEPADEKR